MASPPLGFFVRGSEGLSLLVGPPFDDGCRSRLDRILCLSASFSDDGSKLAVVTSDFVSVYDTGSGSEHIRLNVAGVMAAAFSPGGTYLQTFQRYSAQQKNLSLWTVDTGNVVFQQFQKALSKSNWPAIQFSEDETVACRLVTNEVHLFDARDFSKGITDRLRLPGILSVKLAFAPPSHIAAYVPEIKGSPSSVRIFECTQVSQGQQVARRSFYKSSSAQLLWNRGSTGLLVVAQSDIDKTNQSYYGESRLHFLTSNGSHEGSVPLSKEGPVHDAQWSPSGTEFLVVYGFMPAKATLFDAKCQPLFEFGTGPYNTVRWSPQGRFLCLAGFGNLPGDVAFWDRSTLKALGSTRAECSVTSEWSADGRYFMTATTTPRLQIDNGIKIFKYDGSLYYEKKYNKLFQAEWQPAAAGVYINRPASPQLTGHVLHTDSKSTAVAGPTKTVLNAPKPTGYKPPHAKSAAAARAQLFGDDENASGSSGELSKSAQKNKKRREKQREKKETIDSNSTGLQAAVSSVAEQLEAVPSSLNGSIDSSGDDIAKRLRNINKKLRQIEEIRLKVATSNGHYLLTSEQKEKLDQEISLREELRNLAAQQKD